MSPRASPNPVVEGNRAQTPTLGAGSLMQDEAEGPWGHRRKTSEPPVPSYRGHGSQEYENMDKSEMNLADIATTAAHPLRLPSRTRLNGEHMPRVNTVVDQPASQRPSSSIDQESRGSPRRSSRISVRMSDSSTSSQPPDNQVKDGGPPPIFDGTAESRRVRPGTASEVEWERIQKLRIDNWILRSQIHEMRDKLRQLQRKKAEADDILFRRLTMHGLGFQHETLPLQGQKNLGELMHDCQIARDAYGPLEDDCNELEDQLSGQEFDLDRLEKQFYKRPPDDAGSISARPLTPAGEDEFHSSSSSIGAADEEEEENEYHPIVARYLSRLGDLDLLHERLDDFLEEKRFLEDERDKRLRVSMRLDTEDQEWLENARNVEEDLSEKIELLEKDLEVMKQDCISQGLLDSDGEPIDFQRREQQSFDGEEDLKPWGNKSEYVKYPLLLPFPGRKARHYEPEITSPTEGDRSQHQYLSLHLEPSYNTTRRINEWLLHRLRISPLDVNFLARTFQAFVGAIDAPHRWQMAVLRLWFRDVTMMDSAFRRYTDSMTTQAPPISNSRRLETGPLFSQNSRSELEYDEVEIKEYPGNPKRR